jgi:hypothetical protein
MESKTTGRRNWDAGAGSGCTISAGTDAELIISLAWFKQIHVKLSEAKTFK